LKVLSSLRAENIVTPLSTGYETSDGGKTFPLSTLLIVINKVTMEEYPIAADEWFTVIIVLVAIIIVMYQSNRDNK